jgi:hypothetical protein
MAPISAVRGNTVEPLGSTLSGPQRHRFGLVFVAVAGGIGRSLAASGSDLFLSQPRPAKAFRISGYIFRAAIRDEFRNVGYAELGIDVAHLGHQLTGLYQSPGERVTSRANAHCR